MIETLRYIGRCLDIIGGYPLWVWAICIAYMISVFIAAIFSYDCNEKQDPFVLMLQACLWPIVGLGRMLEQGLRNIRKELL